LKYTPKLLDENVNTSNAHPLKEFAILTGGMLGVLILVYVLLGFALEWVVVPRIPDSVEQSLGELFLGNYTVEDSPEAQYLQGILDRLVEHGPSQTLDYRLHVEEDEMVNAMALPGGHIVLYRGLLDRVESENELAMILGHELGHFAKRHHLRGLGRGLVLLVLSATLLGDESGVTQFLEDSLSKVESRFSQLEEREVDEFGLHLLQETYDHVTGATDFFERIQKEEREGPLAYFFASHPSPANRVDFLNELIASAHYPIGEKAPLDLPE
jgi:predicted Zn-dependent protease